ncbi:hypothetical protein DFH08DRAFT_813457 [Mycena albidolilacea]|uniref:Uncharacterized protein n=1 Tax=Mycena albidolilacea TaxID=1033008 RepID=A0AAD6ZRL8_9AGAR|nr:hypothetical protein DFH08DRAFT_813457 [Mycena albidolilacea]
MVDELKVEERLCWDPATNVISGLCCEHSVGMSLEFVSENELKLILEDLRANKTHLAVEATVASLGLMTKDPTLYGTRTGLISGSCKQESDECHSKILKTALDASAVTKLRTTCICSDREAHQGEPMIRLTFKFSLAPSSPIYPLLHGLEFLNLMVGGDNLTGDKDYKHCFKRLCNWLLRKRNLLLAIWRSQWPSFVPNCSFTGLHRFGLATCCNQTIIRMLSLHMTSCTSSAAHLLLALMPKTNAGAKFMPTQLYIDLMLMIKNIFFCIAKTQADCPMGEFWLMLLGTDRLEVLFGILRTMVGSNTNVDLLQLALHITGTTEVSTILALFPHWDTAPRCLKLPVLSENDIEIEQKQDHITPSSWTGDVAVKNINLRTAWIMGRKNIEGEFPALTSVLKELSDKCTSGEKIDILQPFGKDIVHAERTADDVDDSVEDYQEASVDPSTSNSDPPPEPFTEDAVVEDDPEQKHSPMFTLGGKEVYKGRWLNQLFRDYKNPQAGSQDRLKRVANLPQYMVQMDTTYSFVIRSDEDPMGTQITLDIPIVTFVECKDKFFVCIGEVTGIIHNYEHHTSLSIDLLGEPSTSITFRLLHIHPALQEADETGKNDWIWEKDRGKTFTTPRRFTELINPDINVTKGQSARLLFNSQDILAIGAMIFGHITAADGPKIASILQSAHFPYQNIDTTEKGLLKALWDNRHTKMQRKSKKSKQKKGIERDASEQYKTSWALCINDNGVDESGYIFCQALYSIYSPIHNPQPIPHLLPLYHQFTRVVVDMSKGEISRWN